MKMLRISAAEVKVSMGFNACQCPNCFLVLIQISAGLICYSSVHNWGKYTKLLRWCFITWGAPPPTLHIVLSMHISRNPYLIPCVKSLTCCYCVTDTVDFPLFKNKSQHWKWCLPSFSLGGIKVRRSRFPLRPRLKLLSAHWWEGGFSQAACTDGLDSQKAGERKGKEKTG